MAHRVWTQCVQPEDFTYGGTEWGFVWEALVSGSIAGVIAGIILGLAAGVFTGIVAAVWAICDRLLNRKLVCLGGDRCSIGHIMSIETKGLLAVDDDLGINLQLSPWEPCATIADVEAEPVQGYLIKEQAATRDIGLGFVHYEDPVQCPADAGDDAKMDTHKTVLHCEIEGPGIHDFCIALKVAAVAIAAAIAICIGGAPPPVCLIALGVAALIAFLAWLISWFTSTNPEPDDAATDGSGHIEAADENDGTGGDYVVITGRWSYDSGHAGWNEIHPVLTLQKIPENGGTQDGAGDGNGHGGDGHGHDGHGHDDHGHDGHGHGGDGDKKSDWKDDYANWCRATAEAKSSLTEAAQEDPENRWVVTARLG